MKAAMVGVLMPMLLASTAAAAQLSAAGLAGGSLPQVINVLEQVRSSSDEKGRRAEKIGSEAEALCTSALRSSDDLAAVAGLVQSRLASDIDEQDAAVEEATGNTQQVRANIDLVQHTLVQLQQNAHFTPAMVENKQRTLDSLQGELRIMLPAFAQLRARAAEAGRRLDDHASSWDVAASLWQSVKNLCQQTSASTADLEMQSEQQRTAMDAALKAVKVAVAAKQEGPAADSATTATIEPYPPSQDSVDPTSSQDIGSDQAVSFVQVSKGDHDDEDSSDSDQDIVSIFDSDPGSMPSRAQTQGEAAPEEGKQLVDLMPKVKQLLAEVQSEGPAAVVDSKKWCQQEQVKAKLSLRAVGAASRELRAEAQAHDEAIAQVNEDLARINGTVQFIQDSVQRLAAQVTEGRTLASETAKDSDLASKILAQAMAILSETSALRGPAGQGAITSVQNANAAFTAARSGQSALLQLGGSLKTMLSLANQTLDRFAAEKGHLEFSRDEHVATRDRTSESKSLYDEQLASTNEYLQKLGLRCSSGHSKTAVEKERDVEIRALSDAQAALEGKSLNRVAAAESHSTALRGGGGSSTQRDSGRNLSPLELAAAEMGVAVDGAFL